MSVAQGLSAITGGLSGISSSFGSIASRLGLSSNYFDQLKPASFRGISFVSISTDAGFGRKQHVHEYPNRDTPWAEDLGKKSRRWEVSGFIIGDDVIAQRDQLVAAVETKGPGTLVHPTYGQVTVSVLDFQVTEHKDQGRYFELRFSFIEAGERLFPETAADTGYSITVAGASLDVTAAASFAKYSISAITTYAKAAEAAVAPVTTLYATAQGIARDVRNAVRATSTLVGSFGRFIGDRSSSLAASTSSTTVPTTTTEALANAIAARAAVDQASEGLISAGEALDASSVAGFSTAAVSLMTAVLKNSVDPADAIRTLSTLATFEPDAPTSDSVTGNALAAVQSATGALIRRAALTALATAASQYQPESQDDALNIRTRVLAVIDAEIDIAGDSEDDDAYMALRSLRSSVLQDLNSRGAALPALKTFTVRASLPALVLANRLYRDADRSDDLVAQAQPIHPAFMPTSFVALSE